MPPFAPARAPAGPFGSDSGDRAGLLVPDPAAALAWNGEKLDFRHPRGLAFDGITFSVMPPANDDGFQIALLAGEEPLGTMVEPIQPLAA